MDTNEKRSSSDLVGQDIVNRQVRWHAILIMLSFVALFTAVSGWASLVKHEILGTGYLPRGVVPILLTLVVFNSFVKKLIPKFVFNRCELALIFASLISVSAISGQEFSNHFYLNLLGLVYYGSPKSQWAGMFVPHLPSWLLPSSQFSEPAVLWAYEGMPEGAPIPIVKWFIPLLCWTPYLFGVYVLLVCFLQIVFPQWERREKLLFPLTQLPSELTEDHDKLLPSILTNLLFWVGFMVATAIYSVRGLHLYFPLIPNLPLHQDIGILFPSGPLTAFNGMPLNFYPEVIGIGFLLSSEVSFSFWLFPLLRRLEIALRSAFGFDVGHIEFLTFQSVGAYIVMAVTIFWSIFYHWQMLRREEGVMVHIITLCVFVGLLTWAKFVAGASILWSSVFLLGLLVTSLVVAKIVAEAGVYLYSPSFRVYQVLYDVFSVNRIGARNVVLLTAMGWLQARSTTTMAGGYLINAFKLTSGANLSHFTVTIWTLTSILVALLICHVTFPIFIYRYSVGKLSWWAQKSSLNMANFIGQYLTTQRKLTKHHWFGLVLGSLICSALFKLRLTFSNFPLHPLGFVAWQSWTIDSYWLSTFIGWTAKCIILRYGGYNACKRINSLAYGLLAGGTTALTFWTIVRLLFPTGESIITD